jgi:hypothetical protein
VNVLSLLDMRELTVEPPTAAGWLKPVNDVSLNPVMRTGPQIEKANFSPRFPRYPAAPRCDIFPAGPA